jgi:hypothetical protein
MHIQFSAYSLVVMKNTMHANLGEPLDEGPRPKSGKSRLNLHGTILEGESIGSYQKKKKGYKREHVT